MNNSALNTPTAGLMDWQLPADHACFADHFPQQALVPGALLLAWLKSRLGEALPEHMLTALHSAKFLRPCKPGQLTQIHWQLRPPHGLKIKVMSAPGPAPHTLLECQWRLGE